MSISLPTKTLASYRTQVALRPRMDTWSQKLFSCCLLFIVCVSIYDTYLVALYRDSILIDERNPICLLLIQQDVGQLTWFMTGKFLGNLAVVSTLLALFYSGFRRTLTVAMGVACFQLLLLIYLQFSDPATGVLDFDGFVSNSPMQFREAIVSAAAHIGVVVPMLMGGVFVKRKWDSARSQKIR